jgi:hypothetical protein
MKLAFLELPGHERRRYFEQAAASRGLSAATDWGELVQVHDDRDIFQASPQELPAIDIHSL